MFAKAFLRNTDRESSDSKKNKAREDFILISSVVEPNTTYLDPGTKFCPELDSDLDPSCFTWL